MQVSEATRAQVSVPEDAFGGDEPLIAVIRGGYVSSVHRGTIAVSDVSGELVLSLGDVEQPAFLRSSAKPFQVMPALLSGAIDRYGINESELAVLCASHSGERRHTEAVLSVLSKIGLEEAALRCGIHPPLHVETAKERWRAGEELTPACNNCSGAHAGMLAACQAMGWPIGAYGDPSHPLQVMTREVLEAFTDIPADSIEYAIDNCAVPTFRLSIRNVAQAFARLATSQQVPPELSIASQRIVRAMTSYPEMVGGEERFDTDLMSVAKGAIVSKGGAEGFHGTGLVGRGLGIALKISDGNPSATPPVLVRVLEHLDALNQEQLAQLQKYASPLLHDRQGNTVGHLEPTFALNGAA